MANILIVEDEPVYNKYIQTIFEEAGHHACGVLDPLEVLPLTKNQPLDAIVLDVGLPNLSGWDLLTTLRNQAKTRHTPIVMVSGEGDTPNRIKGIKLGASDFLKKPLDPVELLVRVEGLIQRFPHPGELSGDLKAYSMTEILQSLSNGQKTGILDLLVEPLFGNMEFLSGRLVHAQYGRLTGAEACASMLALEKGEFRFQVTEDRDIQADQGPINIEATILSWAKNKDDLKRYEYHLPDLKKGLSITGKKVKVPDELQSLPIAAVLQELQAKPGQTTEQLLNDPIAATDKIRLSLAWLISEEVIKTIPSDNQNMERVISRFFNFATCRSFPLKQIPIRIHCDGRAKEKLTTILGECNSPVFKTSRVEPNLEIIHPSGTIRFQTKYIELAKRNESSIQPRKALVEMLWIMNEWSEVNLQKRMVLVAEGLSQDTGLLIVPGPFLAFNSMKQMVHQHPGWVVASKIPNQVEDLLMEIIKLGA